MKTAIIFVAVIGPSALLLPSAEALLVPSSASLMIAVSLWAPHPAEGQSRGVPSTTVRPGIVTPGNVSLIIEGDGEYTIGTLHFGDNAVRENTSDCKSEAKD